jgi:regulator of replication initiation timing
MEIFKAFENLEKQINAIRADLQAVRTNINLIIKSKSLYGLKKLKQTERQMMKEIKFVLSVYHAMVENIGHDYNYKRKYKGRYHEMHKKCRWDIPREPKPKQPEPSTGRKPKIRRVPRIAGWKKPRTDTA